MSEYRRTEDGHTYRVMPADGSRPTYPAAKAHTWGTFAGLVVELGGYNDVELIDPYTGGSFWFSPANPGDGPFSLLKVLRQAIDAAEAAGWPSEG